MSTADDRAVLAHAWDRAARDTQLVRVTDARVPEGFTAWRLGSAVTVLPTLLPSAPPDVRLRYEGRARANLIGTCPLCGAVADLSSDPSAPAAWRVLPLTVGISHEKGCGALFTDEDRQHFDPRALGRSS